MSHSFAQRLPVACSACGQWFAPVVWLVVDVDERPTWAADIEAGALNHAPCPHCGAASTLDAPLLLVRPGRRAPLLYSPPTWAREAATYRTLADALMARLREGAGAAWQTEWDRGPVELLADMMPMLAEDEEMWVFSPDELLNDPATPARSGLPPTALADFKRLVEFGQLLVQLSPDERMAVHEVAETLRESGVAIETVDDVYRALAARPDLQARLDEAEPPAEAGDVTTDGRVAEA